MPQPCLTGGVCATQMAPRQNSPQPHPQENINRNGGQHELQETMFAPGPPQLFSYYPLADFRGMALSSDQDGLMISPGHDEEDPLLTNMQDLDTEDM